MSVDPNSELLSYYERELSYLRKSGTTFAKRYPKIAGRLRLSPDECEDPHVERLLEGFAFLTGRLQRDVENEFPEVTRALMEVLYPQLVMPVPPMAVAQFTVDTGEGKMTTGHRIPQATPLFAQAADGQVCRFRTGAPITLWPIKLAHAGFEPVGRYPFLENRPGVGAVLRLVLDAAVDSMIDLELDSLRLYINGDGSTVARIIELLLTQVQMIALLPDGDSNRHIFLDKENLQQAGFADDEALLPYPAHAHKGYRLLQEYFAFPQKFRFFDIAGLDQTPRGDKLEILIGLERNPRDLLIDADNFLPGCAPIINLFHQVSDPIHLDHRRHRYQLFGDSTRQRTTEVHSVLKVSASPKREDDTHLVTPFFSFKHHGVREGCYWVAHRQPCFQADMPGTDTFLAFVDLGYENGLPPDKLVYAHTLCSNRSLAEHVTNGTVLQIERASPLATVRCITNTSPPISPQLGGGTFWKLISHLSLNYLSLTEGEQSLEALKEILGLYASPYDPSHENQIRGIVGLECTRKMHHLGVDAWRGFCRGLKITLEFDDRLYAGAGPLLLASVLNRFFALYASINAFTQLEVKRKHYKGIWRTWPPMAGERIML